MKRFITFGLLIICSTIVNCQETNTWIKDTTYLRIGISFYGDTIFHFKNITDGQLKVYFDKDLQYKYMSLNFENGKKIEDTRFHLNGKEKSKILFDTNSIDSIYYEWYSSGTIKKESFYEMSFFHESEIYLNLEYYEDSRLKKITTFQDYYGYYSFNKITEFGPNGIKSIEQTFELIQEEDCDGNLIDIMIPQPLQYYLNGRAVEKEIFEKIK